MKLRVGYLKERKPLIDVEDWTVRQLEDAIREKFAFDKDISFGVYFGENQVNDVKTARVTQLGVVSGDLLLVRVESDKPSASKSGVLKEKPKQSAQEEKMDTSAANVEEMHVEDHLNDLPIQLDRVVDLIQGRMHQIDYEKYDEYSMNESHVQTNIFYFKHAKSPTRIRYACSSFTARANNFELINNVHLVVSLIHNDKMTHFECLDVRPDTKMRVLDDFMQELKEAVFGPDNLFLKAMFCGDIELTMRLFNLCDLNDVIHLRRTCKSAYRTSNTKYLDIHYWKKQFIRIYGEHQLPTTTSKEVTPYRKALFKKLRDQDKAAYFQSMQAAARQEAMAYYHPRGMEDDNPLRVSPRDFRPRDPYGFDPLRNFDENFYGQEVYRPRNPNPHVPNAPRIYPHFHGDPGPRRHDPDTPQGPFSNNRFI